MTKSDVKPWGYVALLYFTAADPVAVSNFLPTTKACDAWAAAEMSRRRQQNTPSPSRVAIAKVEWVIDG